MRSEIFCRKKSKCVRGAYAFHLSLNAKFGFKIQIMYVCFFFFLLNSGFIFRFGLHSDLTRGEKAAV